MDISPPSVSEEQENNLATDMLRSFFRSSPCLVHKLYNFGCLVRLYSEIGLESGVWLTKELRKNCQLCANTDLENKFRVNLRFLVRNKHMCFDKSELRTKSS